MSQAIQHSGQWHIGGTLLGLALAFVPLLASCGPGELATPPREIVTQGEIERVSVTSTHLQSVGYDDSSRTLTIEFRDGSIYEYEDVPQNIHAALMAATSHGRYFHRQIRDAGFRTHRVR